MLSEKRTTFRPQPKDTFAYEVQPSDTLESIAAKYNVIPSELTVLNRLSSRMVFPGQVIYIPEKGEAESTEQKRPSTSGSDAGSPKPGRVERISGSDSIPNESEDDEDNLLSPLSLWEKNNDESAKKSLKINSKHVTDGEGVVSGTLLVTPNVIMFDPNVSDPLVLEYGVEKYGVVASIECVVRAALYPDIFRMRTKGSRQLSSSGKMNLYHSQNLTMKKSQSHDEKISDTSKTRTRRYSSALESKSQRSDIIVSSSFQDCLSKISEVVDPENVELKIGIDESEDDNNQPSSLPADSLTVDKEDKNGTENVNVVSSSTDSDEGPNLKRMSHSEEEIPSIPGHTAIPHKRNSFEKTKHKLHKGLKKLSIPDGGIFSNSRNGRRMSLPVTTSSVSDSKLQNTDEKHKQKLSQTPPSGMSYVNMVDEKPELFISLDKLIPRPAKSFDDTPLYLCLLMGKPQRKSSIRSTPVIRFGQKMKPEYWFSIPKDSVDNLYKFILHWYPQKYGDIDDVHLEELGYLPIESDDSEETETHPVSEKRRATWAFPWRKTKDATSSSPEDWEFLDRSDSSEHEILPELLTASCILNDEQILQINKNLPPRVTSYSWDLVYGTAVNGFSLKTMYREMIKCNSPVLIVIVTKSNAVFGALLSCALRISDHFYGTGETFLFTFSPEFKVFRWSGENSHFIKGNTDSFVVGASEGHFGLWLDDDLYRGRTKTCQTFSNDPLCEEEDFVIKSLEAWGFI